MGKTRLPLEFQKAHLTKAEKAEKAYIEEKASGKRDELNRVNKKDFVNNAAQKEYKRILANIEKLEIIGNLDKAHLLGYANAYGYIKVCDEQISKDGLVDSDGKINAYATLRIKYGDELRKYARLCGLTIDSRLKAATTKTIEENEGINDTFGDI